MQLRQRHRKSDPLTIVRNFDAFPKIPDEYKVGSRIGGLFSIVSRLLIVLLVYKELQWYADPPLVFRFRPDTRIDGRLKMFLDMTVATPCRNIGADILDSTNQNVMSFGVLEEDDTWWDLCPKQRAHFDYMQGMHGFLREEYHSLSHLLFKSIGTTHRTKAYELPERSDRPDRPYDACRIHGELLLNKVAGNLHIIGGKSLHFPQGHVHISPSFGDGAAQNFSHRIDRFAFGDGTLALVQPLEGDEKVFWKRGEWIVQYFVEVVPTSVSAGATLMQLTDVHTYQYSVRENVRQMAGQNGPGIPGIYFKYDVSALQVHVEADRENVFAFVVRLGSVISGIVVVSGAANALVQLLWLLAVADGSPEAEAARNGARQRETKVRVDVPATAAAGNALLSIRADDFVVCPVLAVEDGAEAR